MSINISDIAWLAGLLEGEGYFCVQSGHKGKFTTPLIVLHMTDLDIVERAYRFMKATASIQVYRKDEPNLKPQFRFSVCGSRAIQWMMTLYAHLGKRRRARIREVLAVWKTVRVGRPVGARDLQPRRRALRP